MTAEELARFRELWEANVPVNTILAEFKFSFSRLHNLVRLLGMPAKRDHAAWVPSPEEIRAEAARIRDSWTDDERRYRASSITDPLPPSFYRDAPGPP